MAGAAGIQLAGALVRGVKVGLGNSAVKSTITTGVQKLGALSTKVKADPLFNGKIGDVLLSDLVRTKDAFKTFNNFFWNMGKKPASYNLKKALTMLNGSRRDLHATKLAGRHLKAVSKWHESLRMEPPSSAFKGSISLDRLVANYRGDNLRLLDEVCKAQSDAAAFWKRFSMHGSELPIRLGV